MSRVRSGKSFLLGVLFLITPPFIPALNVSGIVGDSFEETAGSGLVIRTKPAGVKVFIDGVERGRTPFSSSSLRPGDHNVRLEKDGYKERRFRITLSGKSRLTVSIEMEEALGEVRVNIHRAAESPAELPLHPLIDGGSSSVLRLPVGFRTIRVRAFGWEEVSRTVYVQEQIPLTVDITLKPAVFKLSGGTVSRRRFNPGNPGGLGAVDFYFEVSAPGRGKISIQDQSGAEVYSALLGPFTDWSQGELWNGRDNFGRPLPEGRYKVIFSGESLSAEALRMAQPVQAGDSVQPDPPDAPAFQPDAPPGEVTVSQIVLETQIDYSIDIYPLASAGGIPGLLFAPVPAALPPGSLQIETALLFGSFSAPERPVTDKAFSSLPFDAALRFSLINRLELAAAFNMNPGSKDNEGYGFSGSAKYVFLSGAGPPLGMAAAFSYAWAAAGGEAPLGIGRGGGLYIPLSLNIDPLTILLSPGMRWPGPDDPIPRLLLSAGTLFRRTWFTAGLSFRQEYDFTDTGDLSFAQRIRTTLGAELKFYPPPSNVVYSLLGGMWLRNDRAGGFGGIGLGLLF
jgi:hypothetical protein